MTREPAFIEEGLACLKRSHLRLLPFREALRGYGKAQLRDDAKAGLNVALLAFPQGMAYAMIAGLPIQHGIYGSAVAAVVGPLFSGSRFITLGPTNATSVLIMSSFLALNVPPEQKVKMLPLLLVMVGAILAVGAWLRVANLIQYISRSVVAGYITGAAVLIITNQVRKVLGFSIPDASTFFDTAISTLLHLPETRWLSAAAGLAAAAVFIALTVLLRKRRLPLVAITLVAVSLLAAAFKWLYVRSGAEPRVWEEGVAMLEAVRASDWNLTLPMFKFEWISQLASVALAIAFLCVLEGTSIGKTLAARSGERLDTNQEMFGMGAANLACGVLSGMPASGSLTRSQLNWTSGAATPAASVINGLIVGVSALVLGPFIRYIPEPVLGVLVISIGVSLFNRKNLRMVTRTTRSDAIVFSVTLSSALLFKLDTAILFGAVTSILLFLRKAAVPQLVEYAFTREGQLSQIQEKNERNAPEVSIVHCEGDLFFGAAELFHDQMRRICADPNLKIVILKMRNAHHLDATSVMALEELVNYMRDRDRILIVSEAREEAMEIFRRSGLIELLGKENVIEDDPSNPTLATAHALKRAAKILGEQKADVSIYVNPAKKGPPEV